MAVNSLHKYHLNGVAGLVVLVIMIAICAGLGIVSAFNPHKDLHNQILITAAKVHNYYRDKPGYWKLSTQSAKDDGLISAELSGYRDYDIQIGQGVNGESGLPANQTFDITIKNLSKSACISLSELEISKDNQLTLQKITVFNDTGTMEFAWDGEHKLPIAKYATRNFCQPQNNVIMWTFD